MSLEIRKGDITGSTATAIVNAANEQLVGGGGVCGAIFRAAGWEQMQAACNALSPCRTGDAVLTPAFRLGAGRYVIHAVGPIYSQHRPAEAERLLRRAYESSLGLAVAHTLDSIAFPLLSAGIYGYPVPEAIAVAVSTLAAWQGRSPMPERIELWAFSDAIFTDMSRAAAAAAAAA